jgi:hypothetical protein
VKPLKYFSGELIQVGDRVRVKRRLRKAKEGVVIFVYDSQVASPPRGTNDYGFSIVLQDGSVLWNGAPGKEVILIGRQVL